MVMVELAKVGP